MSKINRKIIIATIALFGLISSVSVAHAAFFPFSNSTGNPGGSDTYVQFNDGSAFGGDSGLVFNKTADRLTVPYASTTAVTVLNNLTLGRNKTSSTTASLTLLSNETGGDNTTDSTSRINLWSWQKAQHPNNFGEVIRINSASTTSKQMIAWYDATTTTPFLKAWVGWHYGPNDADDTLNPHDHWSIETNDSSNIIRTRLEVDAASQDTTQINTFNSNFTVIQGVNGVTGTDGNTKSFSIFTSTTNRNKTIRWAIQGNATAESGANVGTDFQISNFADNGTFIGVPFFINRSNSRVGIGTTSPQARLNLRETSDIPVFHLENVTGSGNNAAAALIELRTSTSRALQAKVFGDTVSRFSVEASGKIEWGPGGGTGRDTNLYRGAANALVTDDAFATGTSTPFANFQATNASANATTTIELGKAGQNKGTCIKVYDEVGTAYYLKVSGGALSVSTSNCASVSGF